MYNGNPMTNNPFFSIVIPTYNRAVLIEETLSSIQSQDFKDFEIVVVDDGSKDNTAEVVGNIGKADPRVRYIYQVNAERGAARNNGFDHAQGKYVMFFDSDDIMPPGNLTSMAALIKENPGYLLYASKFVFIENDRIFNAPVTKLKPGVYGLDLFLEGNPVGTLFTVKRDSTQFRKFHEDRELAIMEDWICLVSNLKAGHQLLLGDFIGCHLINHDGRSMSQNQLVIKRRLKATELLDKELDFTAEEKRRLWAFTYYFCAVHEYLDFNRRRSLQYIMKAVKTNGMNRLLLVTFVKSMIGKRFINKLKRFTQNG